MANEFEPNEMQSKHKLSYVFKDSARNYRYYAVKNLLDNPYFYLDYKILFMTGFI